LKPRGLKSAAIAPIVPQKQTEANLRARPEGEACIHAQSFSQNETPAAVFLAKRRGSPEIDNPTGPTTGNRIKDRSASGKHFIAQTGSALTVSLCLGGEHMRLREKALADKEDSSFALTFVTAITLPLRGSVYHENGFHVHNGVNVSIHKETLTG